jgi:hypothetical protein
MNDKDVRPNIAIGSTLSTIVSYAFCIINLRYEEHKLIRTKSTSFLWVKIIQIEYRLPFLECRILKCCKFVSKLIVASCAEQLVVQPRLL